MNEQQRTASIYGKLRSPTQKSVKQVPNYIIKWKIFALNHFVVYFADIFFVCMTRHSQQDVRSIQKIQQIIIVSSILA